VARYRLRFLLQEFDLPIGTTYIGRSSECQVTIEDPLVSRKHACIEVTEDGATVSDSGSRNGVRVNGQLAQGKAKLATNDRIRIGTLEMVFTALHEAPHVSKTTGFLRHCAACRIPYPEESGACPSCGSADWLDDDTVTERSGETRSWRLQLYLEVIERALAKGELEDADRNLRRASAEVDERCTRNVEMDPSHWRALQRLGLRLALGANNVMWGSWVIRLHRQMERVPDDESFRTFALLREQFPVEVPEVLYELAKFFAGRVHLPGATDAAQKISAAAGA
jgi:Inner membrane component of T3SS, cytoplasmic domain